MSPLVFVPTRYESRYSLLGAMAEELGDAFRDAGCRVNPDAGLAELDQAPALLVFFNFRKFEAIPDQAKRVGSKIAVVQFFVDHPLALAGELMDQYARLPNFRMVLPCVDGLHWLRMRWPNLKHAHVLHAVPRRALCPADTLEASHRKGGREWDVVVAGSIHSQPELDEMRLRVPSSLHKACDEMIGLMIEHPWVSFEQAMDTIVGSDGVITGVWPTATGLFRYVSAEVNRARRLSLARSMQGLRTLVLGGAAWTEACTGTLQYGGDTAYGDLPAALARGRVCLAWGPTQFTQSFSERLLLSMAAGCATIADDRVMVRKHFDHTCVRLFDAALPDTAREEAERLLKEPALAALLGANGRERIERQHLWQHRLPQLGAVATNALAA